MEKKEVIHGITCPFCLLNALTLKMCKGDYTMNFWCKECRSSGFINTREKERFIDVTIDMVLYDGLPIDFDIESIAEEGINNKIHCFLCDSKNTFLKRQKRYGHLFFICRECRLKAYFHCSYIKLFTDKI